MAGHFDYSRSAVVGLCLRSKDDNMFRRRDDVVPTHYWMNGYCGGVLTVPEHRMEEFNRKYADDIDNGQDHCISECRSPIHKPYFDLDFEQEEAVTHDDMISYVRTIQQALKKFFQSRTDDFSALMRCVVLTRPSQRLSDEEVDRRIDAHFAKISSERAQLPRGVRAKGKEQEDICAPFQHLTKSGAHVIFPDLAFDKKRCHAVYGTVLALLARHQQRTRPDQNPNEKVCDDMTFTGTGLRMPGSIKALPCPDCKGIRAKMKMCPLCRASGKLKVITPYTLSFVLNGQGEVDQRQHDLLANIHRLMPVASIRLGPDAVLTPGYKVYTGAPMVPWSSKGLDSVGSRFRDVVLLPSDHPAYKMMIDFLGAGRMGDAYRNTGIKSINKLKNNRYLVQTRGEGSNYCQNLGADHSTKTIYFWITQNKKSKKITICQRCYCRCPQIRHKNYLDGVRCADYYGVEHPLPPPLQLALFPDIPISQDDLPSREYNQTGKHALSPMEKEMQRMQRVLEQTSGIFMGNQTTLGGGGSRKRKRGD